MPISEDTREKLKSVAGLSDEFIAHLEKAVIEMSDFARASAVASKSKRQSYFEQYLNKGRWNLREDMRRPHSVGAHPHSVGAHPHSVGAHPHSVGAHPHSVGAHPHSVGAHPHSVGAHPHSVGAHPHSVGAHPHSVGAHMDGEGGYPEEGYSDPEDQLPDDERMVSERFLIMSGNILSNPNIEDKIAALHELVDAYAASLAGG